MIRQSHEKTSSSFKERPFFTLEPRNICESMGKELISPRKVLERFAVAYLSLPAAILSLRSVVWPKQYWKRGG